MKKIFILPALLILVSIIFFSFSGNDSKYPGGSPGGYSGSPGDMQNCTSCHGSATNITNVISSNVPVSGYIGGTLYTITLTLPGSGKKGFEVSPQSVSGTLLGTLTAGTGSKLTNASKAVTHSSSVSTNPAVWTFSWTAPATGTGPVTFYGAFCVGKSNIKLSTLVVPEFVNGIAQLEITSLNVFPNPAHEKLIVTYSLNCQQAINMVLCDLTGKQINLLKGSIRGSGNHSECLTLPANVSPGVYYLRISTLEKITTLKIIIY
jgi:hypothetical protein